MEGDTLTLYNEYEGTEYGTEVYLRTPKPLGGDDALIGKWYLEGDATESAYIQLTVDGVGETEAHSFLWHAENGTLKISDIFSLEGDVADTAASYSIDGKVLTLVYEGTTTRYILDEELLPTKPLQGGDSAVAGEWVLSEYDPELQIEVEIRLSLNEDGSGQMSVYGINFELSWHTDNGNLNMTISSSAEEDLFNSSYSVDGDLLVIADSDGSVSVFARVDSGLKGYVYMVSGYADYYINENTVYDYDVGGEYFVFDAIGVDEVTLFEIVYTDAFATATVGNTICTARIGDDDPFIARLPINENISFTGLSFKDPNGTTHYFKICWDTAVEDSGVYLSEFTPA